MPIPVTILRRNSGRNLVGLKTSSSKTYGRAEQVSVQAGAALVAADTPLVSPESFTGSTLVVNAAAAADPVKMVLLSPKMASGQFGVATDWAVVGANTDTKAHGTAVYAAAGGAIDWTGSVQVGISVGTGAVAGYILLKPGSF